jgi:hypothetical protein
MHLTTGCKGNLMIAGAAGAGVAAKAGSGATAEGNAPRARASRERIMVMTGGHKLRGRARQRGNMQRLCRTDRTGNRAQV